jgi:DNA processing protein
MYPPQNAALFARAEASGALVTEFDAGTPPARWTFPRRNRIVAALANAVVVVQAGGESGALITARIARGLGVPLGAVPGNAGDPRARGCHDLLREGAALVEDVRDVLALVERCGEARQLRLPGIAAGSRPQARPAPLENLTGAEKRILDLLGPRPIHIDDIAAHAGLGPGETGAAVLSLEVAGLVEDQGGKNFVRVG